MESNDIVMIIISIIGLFNTIVLIPVTKFCFYLVKEINYIKGHLNIKE